MLQHHVIDHRLWLARQDANIFVEEEFARRLKPFQRDGIRFLYAQFCKKNPGVVLNDPSGYGKTVQCTVFIKAIMEIIQPHPVLILTNENNMQHWKNHFDEWTNTSKVDPGETIKYYPLSKMVEASKQEWSIVVLDSDKPLGSVPMLKQLKSVRGKFKIWITSEDLMNKLDRLSVILKWLSPKLSFDPANYDTTRLEPHKRITKEIELDTLCQNIVLRRENEQVITSDTTQRERKFVELERIKIPSLLKKEKTKTYAKNEKIQEGTIENIIPKESSKSIVENKFVRDGIQQTDRIENCVSDVIMCEEAAITNIIPTASLGSVREFDESDNFCGPVNLTDENKEVSNSVREKIEDVSSENVVTITSSPSKIGNTPQGSTPARPPKDKIGRNSSNGLNKAEEIANKKFKGTLLDSLF